jgi:predicted N-formylglutamate amidohydrolase
MQQPSPPDAPFAPLRRINGRMAGGALFLCDHASPALPQAYGDLGLTPEHFTRHIAYDIGAAALTEALAARFEAPALLTTFSRLLIDPNRGGDDPTLVMRISDRALIPGNARIDEVEVAERKARYWQPYRDAIDETTRAMQAAGYVPALISIHSFTPIWRGNPRKWQAAILWDCDDRLAKPLLQGLRASGIETGDNEPYDGALRGDTMFDHGTLPGLPHILIEIRQDLIADAAGVAEWALRLTPLLQQALAAPGVQEIKYYPSRAADAATLARLRETQK